MIKASLISIGAYAPSGVLTNLDLEKMVDTSDEWITKRTGIKSDALLRMNLLAILVIRRLFKP